MEAIDTPGAGKPCGHHDTVCDDHKPVIITPAEIGSHVVP